MAAHPEQADPPHTLVQRYAAALSARKSLDNADAAKAKLCLIDFLACALTSADLPWCRQAIEASAALPEASGASAGIVGTGKRVTPLDAVFANAVLGHGIVRDDMHLASVSHLSVAVVPTALAIAETRRVSGRALLAAIVAGYEAGGKLGRALLDVEVSRIHRPTGLVGPFAATAAAARLLELPADAFAHALSLAVNTCAGYNEWAATGGSEMFFQAGFAARSALSCVSLASAGAYISPTAIEGPAGLFAAFGKPADKLATPYAGAHEIQAVFFKEVPACNFAQTPAQAAQRIARAHSLDVQDIQSVVASVTFAAANYPGCDSTGPFDHALQAKMSIPYNVAAALATGNFDEDNFDQLKHKDIAELARRVTLEIDETLTQAYPARQGARVTALLADGRKLEGELRDVVPASTELVHQRLHAIARQRLGDADAARLVDYVDALESRDDVGHLVRLTQFGNESLSS